MKFRATTRWILILMLGVLPILYGVAHSSAERAVAFDGEKSVIVTAFTEGLSAAVHYMDKVLFFKLKDVGFLAGIPVITEVPLLILWLVAGGIFFTLWLGFINFRLFGHAIAAVRGKYDNEDDPGEVSHFAALSAAVSATVGLGNIAGVALAVSAGGPGAVVWMVLAGFLGMSTKFSEVTLGQKYRRFNEKGRVAGGAFYYLQDGLKEKNLRGLGRVLAVFFAICCIGGSIGGGNMFQSSQSVAILSKTFSLKEFDWVIALVLAVSVGMVLIGGIRRIASVAEKIVPLMAFIYISAAMTVLIVNAGQLGEAFHLMFSQAFDLSSVGGGVMGAIIAGVTRSAFSNEAGLGSAPIAHAAAKTNEPVREGCVALLEPFLDTVVICFITGLVIVVTGVYATPDARDGVLLTSAAFATVIDWFPMVLSVAILLFAYSTMMTWSYYGERAWGYLFGFKRLGIFHVIFCTATFIGGVAEATDVVDFSTYLLLMMAVPNLIGMYILSGDIRRYVKVYVGKLKSGEMKRTS